MTREGIYGKIEPEHEGNPEGGDQGISRGLRLYFTVYPDLSHNTDILNFKKLYFHYCPSCLGNIERVDSPYWSGSWGYIFPYCPEDEAIQVHVDPVENSVVAALGNKHS